MKFLQDPDPQLVDKLRSKDTGAFELVFNEYYSLLKSYAFRFMDDMEDAEEVVQDVFVKFWEKCEGLAPNSSVKSYLYRSVHNTCLNILKHAKIKDAYREHVIYTMEKTSDTVLENETESIEKLIYDAIDDLPPRCSEIFKLSRFDGLKYQEIADHLNISIKTVEVQMGKALKTLREELRSLS